MPAITTAPHRLLGVAAVSALLALGACKTNDDPSKAGLSDGIVNLATGKYKDRQRRLKGNLKDAEASRSHWKDEAARMKAENERLAAEERRLERQLAAAHGSLARSRARVQRASTTGAPPAKVRKVANEIEALQRRLNRVQKAKLPVKRKAELVKNINTEHEALRLRTKNFTDIN